MDSRKPTKIFFPLLWPMLGALTCAWFGQVPGARADLTESFRIETFKTHSRLVFDVDPSVATEWKPSRQGFELLLKGIGFGDLGVPLGEEERWKAAIKARSDLRVGDLSVAEEPGGVRVRGKWKFPSGDETPANPTMESFEYHMKNPSAFVVDFWMKKGPTAKAVKTAHAQAERLAAIRNAEAQAKSRAARRLASAKAKAESDDLEHFCRLPLQADRDVFLPFFPAHEKLDLSRWFPMTTPDSDFHYYEPTGKAEDAQYVRLALSLYRDNKLGLAIRTLDFFEQEKAGSSYQSEMRFLRANALLKLGLRAEAEKILAALAKDSKDSAVSLYAGVYEVGKLLSKGNYLESLEAFLTLIAHHPEHRLSWVFHLGAAESLYALKQTDRAAKEYEWVIEHGAESPGSIDPLDQAEAALRIGDLYLNRFQYDQALAAYYQALSRFAKVGQGFPAAFADAFVNRAETLYQLGQLDRAREGFQSFLDHYPNHPKGWRAAFRIAEIYGRQSGPNSAADSRKWFYATINQFPFSPGATLARLRLLPCDDHGGMDLSAAERFFSGEAEHYEGKGEVDTGAYRELKTVAHIRTLVSLGQPELALNTSVAELGALPKTASAGKLLAGLIQETFRKEILARLAKGNKYDALALYREKAAFIERLEGASSIDPEYLLRLSQAASDLGLGRLGEQLAQNYQRQMASRSLASVGHDSSDLDHELKVSEQHFSEAKALWVASGLKEEVKIREHLEYVREESPYSYERELLLGLMDEKVGKASAALPHAEKAQLLSRAGVKDPRVAAWVARLEATVGDKAAAAEIYRNLEDVAPLSGGEKQDAIAMLGIPTAPTLEAILTSETEVLEQLGRWAEAAVAYSKLVDRGWGGNRSVYEYARALLKTRDATAERKAEAVLEGLAQAKQDDFWKKLAIEALADAKSRKLANQDAKEGTQ